MRASPGIRGAFALLVVMTVGLKVVVNTSLSAAIEQAAETDGKRQVRSFMSAFGFEVEDAAELEETPFVTGVSGSCRVTVLIAAAEGWLADSLTRMATPEDHVFFVYKGSIYASQPVWRTWLDQQRRRLARFAGVRNKAEPVLGVLETSACRDEQIWRGFPGGS